MRTIIHTLDPPAIIVNNDHRKSTITKKLSSLRNNNLVSDLQNSCNIST